jgi:hypothetical protein
MNGQYPRFKNSYFYEELTENFLLTPAELEFVRAGVCPKLPRRCESPRYGY